jgi:hypothetical protein
MSDKDFCWLVGILEGEGSFLSGPPSKPNSPVICVEMTDEDVVSRVSDFFGVSYHLTKRRKANHKQAYAVRITGGRAISWMKILQPHMSHRRTLQIETALASFDSTQFENRWKHSQKMTCEMVADARRLIDSGQSLRSVARSYGVNHETLRQRLKGRPSLSNRVMIDGKVV